MIFRFERNKTALEETLVYFISFTFIFTGVYAGEKRREGETKRGGEIGEPFYTYKTDWMS